MVIKNNALILMKSTILKQGLRSSTQVWLFT
jgi:hypothetical protein